MVGLPKASTYQQKVTIHTGNGNSINVPANKVHTQSMSVKSDGSVFVNDGRAYRPRYTALTKPDYSHIRARNSDGWDLRYQNQIKNMYSSSGRTQSKGMSTFEKAMLITAGIGTLATAGIGIGKAISSLSDFGGFNSDGKGGLGGSEILKALEMANDETSLTAALADAEDVIAKSPTDTEITSQKKIVDDLNVKSQKADKDVVDNKSQITIKKNTIDSCQTQIEYYDCCIGEKNTQIDNPKLNEEIHDLECKKMDEEDKKEKAEYELSNLQIRQTTLENNANELKDKVISAKKELNHLEEAKNNKAQIEGNIKKYKKKLEKMKKKNDKKHDKIAADLQKQLTELKELKSKQESASGENKEKLQKKIDKVNAKINEIEKRYNILQGGTDRFKDEKINSTSYQQ